MTRFEKVALALTLLQVALQALSFRRQVLYRVANRVRPFAVAGWSSDSRATIRFPGARRQTFESPDQKSRLVGS